jgi:small-conductance mechanosensitive channel
MGKLIFTSINTMPDKVFTWYEVISAWLLLHGLRILIIAGIAYFLKRTASRFIEKIVRKMVVGHHFLSAEAERKREDTLIRIFNWAVSITIVLLAALMILQEVGVPIGPILAGAGIVGIALGFGGQYLVRDLITGFFMILENQYRIGDIVNFDGTSGVVEDISLRMTTLRNQEGTVHHIPHGEIKRVSNLSKDFARINLNMNVSYTSNLEHVITVVNRVGEEMAADPRFKDLVRTPPRFLRIDDFADSAIVIKILGETQPNVQFELTGELRMRLKIAFDKEGIEIPFPQRIVHHVDHTTKNFNSDGSAS